MTKLFNLTILILLISCSVPHKSVQQIKTIKVTKSFIQLKRDNIIQCIEKFILLEVKPLSSHLICKETYSKGN